MKNKILELVNSLEFQELKSYYDEKTIFNALNVERNENRHSAFIAWWLNPKSEHGLGDAPLKLFLRLVATKDSGKATFGIDGFDGAFYNRVLTGNYNIELLEEIEVEKNVGKICNNNSKDRIDIWTVLELSYEEDSKVDRRIIPVVIENKIYSNEGKGQTDRYLKALKSYPSAQNAEMGYMGILLSVEPTKPSCNQFENIVYQELLTYVIEPLVFNVEPNSAQFVESFIRNLSLPAHRNKKYYRAIASSKKEKNMLQRVVDKNREIFDTAFSSLHKPSAVKNILDKNSKVLPVTDEEVNILRMLWDTNEEVFKAVIYYLNEPHKTELDTLFKTSNRDTSKYIVYYKDQPVFPGKRLSKAMTACAIFKAYLKEYPASTLNDLQKAFPCDELNNYYYDRYYNDLFYESNPGNINEEGEEVLLRTGGKNIGSEALAKWDFYLDNELLLPIENGTKNAMCVRMWRKGDFDRLIERVKGYKFITIEEC